MLRVGVDLIEIARVEEAANRWGERFLRKIFTEAERTCYEGRIASLAARFAAKEAASKALGTGLMTEIPWTDIEVLTGPAGEPGLHLHGRARQTARFPIRRGLPLPCPACRRTQTGRGDQPLGRPAGRASRGATQRPSCRQLSPSSALSSAYRPPSGATL